MMAIFKFLDSNFLQTASIVVIGIFAYKISKLQKESIDTVELHAYCALEGADASSLKPYVRIQNIGTRIIYIDNYFFNGKKYPLSRQVLPSVYSQASANFFWIELPTNDDTHVSITILFLDQRGEFYESEILCDKSGVGWKVCTYAAKKIKL